MPGRRSTRCALASLTAPVQLADALPIDQQEAQEKYRASKAELDELVANMEGL